MDEVVVKTPKEEKERIHVIYTSLKTIRSNLKKPKVYYADNMD